MDAFDHRSIGSRLGLFHQQEEGPGVAFWHPRGQALWLVVEDYVRRRMRRAGYREVRTPLLLSRGLWERSGHWEKFGDNMFHFQDGERSLALKPMSCPGHLQIFAQGARSYRDLPLRFAEFGLCHRYEPSGALAGLMRTRSFVQDDAHVFCTEAQVEAEVARFCGLLREVYDDFGFPGFEVAFADRPALRAGDDAGWERAEAALQAAARRAGLDFALKPGEGAFYGPKLEFILADSHGRRWQCGTVQLDFVLPERLDAAYTDAANRRRRPVMLHHAVLGSLERFIAVLLEHHRGRLPMWLAPEQVLVANVEAAQAGAAQAVAEAFEAAGLRVASDLREVRLSEKAGAARELAIPALAVVGAREAADGRVALRLDAAPPRTLPVAEAIAALVPTAFR